ncbi:S53 family serine peptidase [Amycolatopsis sp. NEAU-NG30]|uniref:S53 family serine peptidase n=1 Tax=Amycolatopsis melonis TaxID=3156488 RepID=A0ABV0LF04_9PSEU
MALRPSRAAGLIAGCAVLSGIASAPAANAQDSTAPGRAAVDGSAPSWATPSARVGHADPRQQRHIQVALALRDPAGAEALAKAVSTPGSPQYGRHLTNADFVARFAPSEQTVDQVTAWLRSQGLRVTGVAGNRHFVEADGEVGQLQAAFRTTLGKFRHTTRDGRTHVLTAPESAVSVPAAMRGTVTAVLGLDDAAKTISPALAGARRPDGTRPSVTPAAGDPTSCARSWGEANNAAVPQKYAAGQQSNFLCGYTSPQLRAIYGLTSAHTGAGQNVGIVGAYNLPTIVSDTNRAAAQFGAPALTTGQYNAVLPASFSDQDRCGPDSWASEQALDVQAIHEVAPAARITYYAGKSCFDLFTTLNRAVADNQVSVINNSWLYPGESTVSQAERDQMGAIAVQAAIQGQAILFASGDSGDNSAAAAAGRAEASYPASHPWVTAVGGTSVALDANNRVKFQTGWENSGNTQTGSTWTPQSDADGRFAGGAGGGVSKLYDQPDYQQGVVPSSIAGGHRAVPDISALADSYTGLAIGLTTAQGYVTYSSGGTSLAAPILVGLVADAQQAHGGARLGFLNGALYAMAGKPQVADVKPVKSGIWSPFMASFGYVTVPQAPGSYLLDLDSKPQTLQSGPGWDRVTGVGTPATGFVAALGQ